MLALARIIIQSLIVLAIQSYCRCDSKLQL